MKEPEVTIDMDVKGLVIAAERFMSQAQWPERVANWSMVLSGMIGSAHCLISSTFEPWHDSPWQTDPKELPMKELISRFETAEKIRRIPR